MRILVANDLYGPSSAAGVAVSQARALARRGHEVHFAATRQQGRSETFDEEGVRVHLLRTFSYDLRFRAWVSLYNPSALGAFTRLVRELAPDVVHFHNVHIHLSYRSFQRARSAGAAVVWTVHDVMPFCFQKMFCFVREDLRPDGPPISFKAPMPKCIPCARFRYNPLRNPWIRRHARRYVDRIVAVSAEMARALGENGITASTVVFNGLDLALAADGDEAAAFRRRHGLEGRKVVLYGGRLDHRKGASHLVRAMARVRRRVPEAALLVVGSAHGGYERRLVDEARALGLGDALVVTGWLEGRELLAAYAAADVVCTPSLIFESFGLINAEGMRAGRPAVTSFFGGPRDVVEHGRTGYHVNPLDVEELARRLADLLEDDRLRRRMGEAARKRVEERFDLERTVDRLVEVYGEALAARRGA